MEYLDRSDLLQLDSFEVRRIKVDLILYYKAINNLIQVTVLEIITWTFTLFIVEQKLENKWCNRLVSLWNILDCSIVDAATVCQSKKLPPDVSGV